jgi:hypothetical protein
VAKKLIASSADEGLRPRNVTEAQRPAMRYLIAKTTAATALGLAMIVGASAAAVSTVHQVASRAWRNPGLLAALPENLQVHYEPGGAEYAQAVAALLPRAIARVESVHGRPFAHSVTVGVYVSHEAFAAGNGLGHARAAGVTVSGCVTLSPILFSAQRQRLPGALTHEMSHAHLQGWISPLDWIHLPNWFKEGLAVMVSGGGGAEFVSEVKARDAIRRGDRIAIESEGSSQNLTSIKFEHPSEASDGLRAMMGYRQAALFVTFLHDRNPAGFARTMAAVLDGRQFKEAIEAGYGRDLRVLWADFLRANES